MDIITTVAATGFTTSWPWYVIRVSGFVAAGLLILLMLSGIGQVTGLSYRFMAPLKAWAVHKAMAFALLGAITVHAGFLLVDRFVSFSPLQILVPFVSDYSNKSTLFGLSLAPVAVGFGILAAYGIGLIVASSLGWIEQKKRAWRLTHYLSYAVFILVMVHALGTGSDLKHGILRVVWVGLAGLVVLAIISRLWRSGTLRDKQTVHG